MDRQFSLAAWALFVLLGVGVGIWLASALVEALRAAPQSPKQLRWARDLTVNYVTVEGNRLRYIRTGQGPDLVLLHTLRTQLDLFEKIIPDLALNFTVYAFDYPGHGYSDIPDAPYDADFFVRSVEGFLDALDLRGVTLCGVSIGGSMSLIVAGRGNGRVARVMAVNPYDYDKGRGIARSSPFGRIVVATAQVPVLGEVVMRFRNPKVVNAILLGGVAEPVNFPEDLLAETYDVGNRLGHYRAFLSLLRNAASWETATDIYQNIRVPAMLVWGDKDWAYISEREHDCDLIPNVRMVTVNDAGHFLPLDQPQELRELITAFVTTEPALQGDRRGP
jgi:pimeloyl-ACP methyl ester carboxylesterase